MRRSILVLVAVVVGAASLYGVSPAGAARAESSRERGAAVGRLRYGDVVALRFQENGLYMVAEENGNVNINRLNAFQWERFLLVHPTNLAAAGSIAYNAPVALRSYKYNKYVERVSAGGVLRAIGNYPNPSLDARWQFVPPTTSAGCVTLDSLDHAVVRLRSQPALTFVRPYGGVARAVDATVPAAAIDLYRQPWTSFYYDKPWHDGTSPGPCPYRGRWDGANCFVITPPYPGPFVWQGNFYANGTACNVVGWFDGAHCQFGSNPAAGVSGHPSAFLWNGSFYLTPVGWAAYMQCADATKWSPYGDLKGCGLPSAIQVGVYPMKPQYNSIGQLVGRTVVPQGQITAIRVCYKKASAIFTNICNQSVTYSGSYVTTITGLQSNTLYRLQGSYLTPGSAYTVVETFNVKTK
jgi:hypothetical protein